MMMKVCEPEIIAEGLKILRISLLNLVTKQKFSKRKGEPTVWKIIPNIQLKIRNMRHV